MIARVNVALENYTVLEEETRENADIVEKATAVVLASGDSSLLRELVGYVNKTHALRSALRIRDCETCETVIKAMNTALPSLPVTAQSKSMQRGEIRHAMELVEYFNLYNALLKTLGGEHRGGNDPGQGDLFIDTLVSSKGGPYMRTNGNSDRIRR